MTEWQVLISALLTQINGYSHIAELWFTDRMSHWNELKKWVLILLICLIDKVDKINLS